MHIDDDAMALMALGEDSGEAWHAEHLADCAACTAELAEMRRIVGLGRAVRDAELTPPPARVWHAISSELGLGAELDPVSENDPLSENGPVSENGPGAGPARAQDGGAGERSAPAPPSAADETGSIAPVAELPGQGARARRSTRLVWLAAAAAALVVGAVGGAVGASLWPDSSPELIAEATLEPFPSWQASGSAQLAETADGREVVVELDAPPGGLREVWLIDPETSGLISLGLLVGSSGHFSVPADVDLERYSVVDISEEPGDGNPAHSGDSIVRGQLRTV